MSKHRTRGIMWNRLVSGVLCLALVLGLLPAGLVQPAEAAYWADPYGQQLVEWGVMRGDISGNLNLANSITRAEFVTMCNRAFGYTKMGTMPFTDVVSTDWYAEDINIAYNAGYFKGTSTTGNIASPNARLTREQAAVLLARNMLLRETSGESLGFSDSRTFNEWSRGLIGAAVAEGMLTGYSDGSFRPANPITRGEVAAMLVRVIGTPISKSGNQSLGDVYGNVTINTSNVSLRNTTIAGNLYITGGVDLGNVLLENVTVLGRIVISGGGESEASKDSITLRNVEAEELVVDSMAKQFVTVLVQGISDIPLTSVRTNAYLNDSSWPGYGLTRIEQDGASLLQLAGSIKEVVNITPSSDLQLVQGSAERITIDELAKNSQMTIIRGTRVDELNLDVATLVTGDEMGKGDIKNLNVGASGSEVDILPDNVEIRPGTTATIEGEKMDSVSGAELSTEPHILAGYPNMVNVAPTEAEAQFGGNKPGTIYWAISSLADGSVSEEDLISNPSYGSNIYEEQAGSRDVSAKTIYSEKVEKLTPDGSYYISAIMVDGRGRRSPLKVAAFTTPDDTVPAFVGTPEITKATTTVAQATATANKNCLLYWALLPKGAAAPTAQQFKTGSVGSNYGYGSLSMVKNAPTSITVNSRRLMEKTEYVLYLWLTDHNGAKSMAAPLALPLVTLDETPPIVTGVEQVAPFAKNTADVTYAINEAPATLYWAVVAQGNTTFISLTGDPEQDAALLSDLRTKIKVESGASAGAIAGGSSSVAEAYTNAKFTVSGLDPAKYGNNFTLYYVGKDAAGNYSEMVGSIPIQTLDTTPPTVVDPPQFTSYNGDKANEPLADTGIKLVFSEQIKGGANASRTFLELYNAAIDPNLTSEAKDAAMEDYTKALSEHIKLYQVPRTGSVVPVDIEFKNVIVTQENNGSVVIFLPGENDEGNVVNGQTVSPAIDLDSGATYYFELVGIFDNAFTPNGVSNTGNENPTGNLRMSNFTTVYAQVNLEWNTSKTKIESGAYDGVRLDVVVDVKPTSTEKVPDTECWDMIVWSDTWIGIKVYYVEFNENGVQQGDWIPLNDNSVAMASGGTEAPLSVGATIRTGNMDTKFPTIKTTLVEGHTYRYGFHITEVRGTKETGGEKGDADSWSDLVTMRFGLIAGASGGVQAVSGNVSNNFDSNHQILRPDLVSYISTANSSTGTSNLLTVPKQFIDTRAPEFLGDYPHFSKTSSTITMDIQLNRPGTVYYVAAPVGEINLSYTDGEDVYVINSDKDGSGGKDGVYGDPDNAPTPGAPNLAYIPENGSKRIQHSKNIFYMEGADDNRIYTNPSYGYITDAKRYYADSDNVFVPQNPASYTSSAVHEQMTGLKADTWYYIFVVLEGGGAPDQVVQVYRVKTDPVQTPEINVTGDSNTANVTPNQDAQITFALVEINALPSFFGTYYNANGTENKDSVIYKMINTTGRGDYKSQFDDYTEKYTYKVGTTSIEVTAAEMKQLVNDYISGASRPEGSVQPVLNQNLFNTSFNGVTYGNAILKGTETTLPLKSYMTATDSEYVLLVMGKHPSAEGDDPDENYGYGAIKGLFTQDEEPPVLTTVGNKGGAYLTISNLTAYDPTSNAPVGTNVWRAAPEDYVYSGSVTLTFNKNVYVLDKSVRYGLYYTGAPSNGKNITTLLGGIDPQKISVSNSTAQIGNTFTLSFDKIGLYETIVLFANGKICNASSYAASGITLMFDPKITAYQLGLSNVDINPPLYVGGFRVTYN